MYYLLLAVLLLSSLLMVILILMQSGKGGGLSGAFGAGGGSESSFFGANTATVIMKATSIFAAIFMISCIAMAAVQKQRYKPKVPKGIEELESEEGAEAEGPSMGAPEGAEEKEAPQPDLTDTGLGENEGEKAAISGESDVGGTDTDDTEGSGTAKDGPESETHKDVSEADTKENTDN